MVWSEIENKAIDELKQILLEANFIDGDLLNEYEDILDKVPFFRGFIENPKWQRHDHLNYDVIPVNDCRYSDNQKESAFITIGIDYVTSNKRGLKRVNQIRDRLERAFEWTGWMVYYTGYDDNIGDDKTSYSYSVRKVFSLR